jgi:hypothetical protein
MELVTLGGITAFATLIVLYKLGIYKFLRFDTLTDLGVTLALATLFAGTMSGLMIAATAGIIVSLVLLFLRKTAGIKQWTPAELFARG